mmetsp:Transcript_22011/g.47850  ORF Transcript_22011/g.47850 Transcript_22011/m.47850 type:complete len:555 (-) Transcript_22011:88-1752(-)|eukprot:CAMPEP_0172311514 /NCGR_PEP_ID=MMETSP1058-20130122/14959_1 /TAXON_ID=83371 /ORGANISM="Detonula confervacea, Strain CCMP 353" /LENGTH=554 /DNA_ID=CAMNT_0013024713 /DNA_START=4 /DNA_END=1668 /DNA_ORIENTATION=-
MTAATPTNLRTMMRSRPPPFAYGIVLFLGAVTAPFLLSLGTTISINSDFGFRRSLSNGSLYSLKDADQYSNLQASHDIDHSIENRARQNDDPDKCSRILLYLPDFFADHGHGSQINTYIMGVTTATYLNRAMVLVEPPLEVNKYAGGSQFGCPIDAFHETMTKTSSLRGEANWHVREDFPLGFSRLIQHPAWLSNGCPVPCADTHGYKSLVQLYQGYRGGDFTEITCRNPDGTETNVVVAAGSRLRAYFREHEPTMTRNHPSPEATQWALNLGATPQEAGLFSNTKDSRKVWDFVLGLMNKAGFFKLQPWIARDVALFLKSFDLPMDEEYSAIHVRRGDKLAVEARGEVVKYWREQGHVDENNLPTDYVPFAHYLSQWDGPDKCLTNEKGDLQVMKHNVYVATDDPIVVRQEIAALPNQVNQNTVLWNDCHQLTFHFNPTDASAFHLNGDGEKGFEQEGEGTEDSCFMRYRRNIASIADMMILSKARTFIGEYNSNWGRVIRTMRVRLNVPVAQSDDTSATVVENSIVQGMDSLTRTLDSRIAWGSTRERSPGY